MTLPSSQIQETFYNLVSDPNARFQKFFEYYCDIKLNPTFSIDKYIRSGNEMIRMANIYYKEHDYFHAFVLYSRYIVLFHEKMKSHPQIKTAEKTQLSEIKKEILKNIFPKAEQLKSYIKEIFANDAKEYEINVEKERENRTNGNQSQVAIQPNEDDLEALKRKYNSENEAEFKALQDKELNSLATWLNEEKKDNLKGDVNQSPTSNAVSDKPNPPVVDRTLKPVDKSTNNYNLRTIMVPGDLTQKFLEKADSNTKRNIETCGILAGKLTQNKFTLSHCIIPKQTGTSDTCSTEQEHELFDTIDQLNLVTLGWIHTHPSQTAFLSSIDLHTHFGYQLMIPEAIAIVCAPSYNEIGTFMLTPDYGLKEIADCSKSGFHPHTNNPPLFEECDHVKVVNNLSINLIDLRVVSNLRH